MRKGGLAKDVRTLLDNDKTILEETIASIVDVVQNIATTSDAMRRDMVAVGDALRPMFQMSGVEYQGTSCWEYQKHGSNIKSRLSVVNAPYRGIVPWYLAVESVFIDGGRTWGKTYTSIEGMSRDHLEQMIKRLPSFLDEYCKELESKYIQYADLRKKAEAIRAIVEG